MKAKQFHVQIKNLNTGEIAKDMGPMSEQEANKVADGAGINLDWENYTIEVVETTETKKQAKSKKQDREYMFVIHATISMHTVVKAKSLAEALEQTNDRGFMSLCHQCGDSEGDNEEWRTSGEFDGGTPAECELEEILEDGKLVKGTMLKAARRKWRGGK